MLLLHQTALYLHIAIGALALILFWIPLFSKKGQFKHRRFGRYFVLAMYTVSGSGLLMSSLDLIFPLSMHAVGADLGTAGEIEAISQIRNFALFLFSLSILILVSTRQGDLVIRHRGERSLLRTPGHVTLCVALPGVGILLLIQGLSSDRLLFIIFGCLQVIAGSQSLYYNFKAEIRNREWLLEHLSSLIGSGIGAYTAFFVFGGSRLLGELFGDAFSDVSIVLWIAPGLIGGIAIQQLRRHYREKLLGNWIVERARRRASVFR